MSFVRKLLRKSGSSSSSGSAWAKQLDAAVFSDARDRNQPAPLDEENEEEWQEEEEEEAADGGEGDPWSCASCTIVNESSASSCSVCSAARPALLQRRATPPFVCHACTYRNADRHAAQCEMCGTKRVSSSSADSAALKSDSAESKEQSECCGSLASLRLATPIREQRPFLASVKQSTTRVGAGL